MRNDSGFTLFELMVVLGIMAILASVAVPGFLGWLPKYRMRSAADEVLATLQHAKLRAVRENSIVSVNFNFVNDSYLTFLDNGAGANAGNGIQEAGETTVKNGRMPAGIDLRNSGLVDALAVPVNLVRFDRRGFPDASGNIVIANGTISRTINLTLGGSSSIN
jgi:prepilin-type N-terminal cleavage/methylation domain-containing protein